MRNAPSRQELIDWLDERAEANERFDGRLSQDAVRQIRVTWPLYLRSIAAMLRKDRRPNS